MFENCRTADEARKEYRRLAKMLHPDIGGNNADMAALNAAYASFKPLSGTTSQARYEACYERTASKPGNRRASSASKPQAKQARPLFEDEWDKAMAAQERGFACGHIPR